MYLLDNWRILVRFLNNIRECVQLCLRDYDIKGKLIEIKKLCYENAPVVAHTYKTL